MMQTSTPPEPRLEPVLDWTTLAHGVAFPAVAFTLDDVSIDAFFATNDAPKQHWLLTGETSVVYHPVHATRDGSVTANIGPEFRAWRGVCTAMGRPELPEAVGRPQVEALRSAGVLRHGPL